MVPRITRRTLLKAGLAGTLTPTAAWSITPRELIGPKETYIWGYPLVLFGRYRDLYLQQGNPLNQFLVQPTLSTPATPGGGPGVDTLYGYTWLDLRPGPQLLHVPEAGDRYYSIQLIDMYSDVFAYVGRRATGTKAGVYAIVGPGWKGELPAGLTAIRAPTDDIMTFARTLVADDTDLPAARDLQSRFAFGDLGDFPRATRYPIVEDAVPLPPVLDLSQAGIGFFDELCAGLAANPPRPEDRFAVEHFAPLCIGPKLRPSVAADDALKKAFVAAIAEADTLIKVAHHGTLINGWFVNFDMVAFQIDPLQRASAVKYGPGGHVSEEALYFNLDRGPDGQPLSGQRRYALRFPNGGLPPVDAFWSLTAYSPTMSLIENPIHRYAIKDRTAGLVFASDGSLEIQIQHAPPAQGTANWLPVPAGPFRLVLRTYQPRQEILTQSYRLPPLLLAS